LDSKFFLVVGGLLFNLLSLILDFVDGELIVVILRILMVVVLSRNVCFSLVLLVGDPGDGSYTDVFVDEVFCCEVEIYESIVWLNLTAVSGFVIS